MYIGAALIETASPLLLPLGSFTHTAAQQEVAVKRFKKGIRLNEVLEELCCCLCLQGVSRVAQLIDAFTFHSWTFLVFEHCGQNLHDLLQLKEVCGPSQCKDLVQQCLEGLQQLEQQKVLHFDIKPANILVKIVSPTAGSQPLETGTRMLLKLCDLGLAMPMEVYHHKEKADIWIQTWPYRAPEVLLRAENCSYPVDMWSVGCVMYDIASGGETYFPWVNCHLDKDRLLSMLRRRPAHTQSLKDLPGWKRFRLQELPDKQNPSLPPQVAQTLGKEGESLLDAMLAYDASARIRPKTARQHPYLCEDRRENTGSQPVHTSSPSKHQSVTSGLHLWRHTGGRTLFDGERAKWRLLCGQLQPDVLQYLRGDPFFQTSKAELAAREFHSFNEPQQRANKALSCRQKECKIIISGGFGEPCSQFVHALRVDKPFPAKRVARWRQSFLAKNAEAFGQLVKNIRSDLKKLSPKQRGQNGKHALRTPWQSWCLTAGQLFLTQAEGRLVEDSHCDGGAGVVHMALTLFGKRYLQCWNSCEKPSCLTPRLEAKVVDKIKFEQQPGTVFLSCSSAFRHQVEHQYQPSADLMTFGDLENLSVSVMFRSPLFPYNRARLAASTPSPKIVFQSIAASFEKWQSQSGQTLVFPSLQEVIGAPLPQASLRSPAPSSSQPAKSAQGRTAKLKNRAQVQRKQQEPASKKRKRRKEDPAEHAVVSAHSQIAT